MSKEKLYLICASDLVFEGDTAIRVKRKYGKRKRHSILLTAEKK